MASVSRSDKNMEQCVSSVAVAVLDGGKEAAAKTNKKENLPTPGEVVAPRFRGYERLDEEPPVRVENGVLFGDCKDVRLTNCKRTEPEKSEGGTIHFSRRFVTSAVPGKYVHGKVYIASQELGKICVLHLIHHESVDGERIGRFLCHSRGMENFRLENVWNRYDWCEFRNWGQGCTECCEEDCSDDDCCHDDCYCHYEEKNKDIVYAIYFVSFSDQESEGPKELGRFTMKETDDVIHGDWRYGARITHTDGKAYAYIFGDCLVGEELRGAGVGLPTNFKEDIVRFELSS